MVALRAPGLPRDAPYFFFSSKSRCHRQGETRLRLLNYQNNLITSITNLGNLTSLIFLDLYNNLIDTLEGPLSAMTALRVVMVGKNRIQKVTSTMGCVFLRVRQLPGDISSCGKRSNIKRLILQAAAWSMPQGAMLLWLKRILLSVDICRRFQR